MKRSSNVRALIDLLKGWPNPTLLPALQIEKAASVALCNADVSIPGLSYGCAHFREDLFQLALKSSRETCFASTLTFSDAESCLAAQLSTLKNKH